MTVVFSAVLNNVTAMIIVGSLTAVSLDKLGRNDKLLGFLLVQGLLTNVGGFSQRIVLGLVILLAVVLDQWKRRRALAPG